VGRAGARAARGGPRRPALPLPRGQGPGLPHALAVAAAAAAAAAPIRHLAMEERGGGSDGGGGRGEGVLARLRQRRATGDAAAGAAGASSARASSAMAATKEEDTDDDEVAVSLSEALAHFKLSLYLPSLEQMGVERVADLAYLQDADLEKLGMPLIPRRKLLEAAGGSWRTVERGGDAAAAAAAGADESGERRTEAATTAAPPTASAVAVLPRDAEADDRECEAELAHLVEDLVALVEDFAAANGLEAQARAALLSLHPHVTLRVIGLLGPGNGFVMRGVRRPSAAVLSRCRVAAQEGPAGGTAGDDLPYEEWQRLLEDFAAVNNLGEAVRESLPRLSRDQALRVMGFTTNLRFILPTDSSDADIEVAARVRAALDGASMLPVVPRPRLTARRPQPAASPGACGPSRTQRLRSRSREHVEPFVIGSGLEEDFAPYWRRNLETFIQLNELDEKCSQVLGTLPRMMVLYIMGLVGRENSFVIHGVRNRSAAVMNRLQQAQDGGLPTCEPYALLPKLVEDFIAVNGFDERGAEAVRALPREEALNVMGFTHENAFVIRGAKNSSAALMSRMMSAQRGGRQEHW